MLYTLDPLVLYHKSLKLFSSFLFFEKIFKNSIYLFTDLFLAVLPRGCCAWALSSSVHGILAVMAFPVVERGLSGFGSATAARGLGCPAGIEPVCPALAGGFLATGPPGKSAFHFFLKTPSPLCGSA